MPKSATEPKAAPQSVSPQLTEYRTRYVEALLRLVEKAAAEENPDPDFIRALHDPICFLSDVLED